MGDESSRNTPQNSKLRDWSPFPTIARLFRKVNPDYISYFGVGLAYLGSAIKAIPELNTYDQTTDWAIGLLAAALACDGLDGAVARLKGKRTEQEKNHGALVDLYSDRLQESGMAAFRILAAMNRKDPIGVISATLNGLTSPWPSYFRAKAESEGYSPSELAIGTRMPRFISASVATVYPEQTLVFDVQNQIAFDLASAGANLLTTVQRMKFIKDIHNGVINNEKNEKIIPLGKEKSRGLLKLSIYNSIVLGLVGVYGVINSIKH